MSNTFTPSPPPPPPLTSGGYFSLNLGLGYTIAVALAFLILLSAVILASYICCRTSQNYNTTISSDPRNINSRLGLNASSAATDGIILPRIVFVPADEDIDGSTRTAGSSFVGLGQEIINSYPKFSYKKIKDRSIHNYVNNNIIDSNCSICLCEYKDSEMVRMLPDCRHCFHLTCVDPWLKLSASCPVCRSSPLSTPMSTPLAEVAPLSQYAGGGGWRYG